MKLILIDGGPASGKNTLGNLLVKKLSELGTKAVLIDLDSYVEKYNPKWIWEDEEQKVRDLSDARIDFLREINQSLNEGFDVIAIGDRWLTVQDVVRLASQVNDDCTINLFHLNVPFSLREQRLYARGPHSLIDLEQDQKDRDAIIVWPGYVYANVHSPEEDAEKLLSFIRQNIGLISTKKNNA